VQVTGDRVFGGRRSAFGRKFILCVLSLALVGCRHHSNTELFIGEDADSVTADFPNPQSIEIKNGATTITWANGMVAQFDDHQHLKSAEKLPSGVTLH